MKMYYKLMTYCCGICIALHWGCTFGQVAFSAIWMYTPMMRLLSIMLHPIRKIMAIVLGTCCAPFAETMGLLFSRIHVTNSTGEPPKPAVLHLPKRWDYYSLVFMLQTQLVNHQNLLCSICRNDGIIILSYSCYKLNW